MRIVHSWLKEFFEPGALDKFAPEEIGDALTSLGLVCESIEPLGFAIDGVVICLLYTSPSPRDQRGSRMPSSA